MSANISRRHFLRLSALSAGGAALAACTPQVVEKVVTVKETVETEKVVTVKETVEVAAAAEAPAGEPVNIRLAEGSWVGPEGIKFWTDDIIPRFELENPGIEVTWESAESEDYADKLYAQAVAGDAPDVFFIWWSGGLMEKGQLLQLDEYFDKAYMDQFYPGNVVGQVLDGKLYGVPKYISTVALGYNKDILDEAGVPYPDGTWDWATYVENCRKCTKKDADGNITQWGNYIAHEYPYHWTWMNGGEWMNADLFGTEALFNQPAAMEGLKLNYDMVYGPDPSSARSGQIPDMGWWNVFSTGKIGLMESHSWTVTNYIRENNFAWDFAALPVGPGGKKAGLTFTNGYSAYNGTKEKEASVKLIEFLTQPWAQRAMCLGILGLQPARKDMAEVWDTASMGAQAGKNVKAFNDIMPDARLAPEFKDSQKANEVFNPIWEQVWVTNELPFEEGVNLAAERVNELYQ
jgi:multiple sugar transport system substrate-binding protein